MGPRRRQGVRGAEERWSPLTKVLVVTPTFSKKAYCEAEFLAGLRRLLDHPANGDVEVNALIVENSNDQGDYWGHLGEVLADDPRITIARMDSIAAEPGRIKLASCYNMGRAVALRDGYDYMLTLESDVICGGDELARLLEGAFMVGVVAGIVPYDDHNTLVCSKLDVEPETQSRWLHVFPTLRGGVMSEDRVDFTCFTTLGWSIQRTYMHMRDIDKLSAPAKVAGVALGCTLIHTRVLRGVEFRYVAESNAFCDVWFSVDVRSCFGDVLAIHPKVKPKHLANPVPWRDVKR